MRNRINIFTIIYVIFLSASNISAQKNVVIRPKEINEVLNNPGIGFTTFNRFNGDSLWHYGHEVYLNVLYPIQFQEEFDKSLQVDGHPLTSIAYFRLYWKHIEPEMGIFNWALIDTILKVANERNQTVILRIAPYTTKEYPHLDVPEWYRSLVGEKNEWQPVGRKWMVDPEDPKYSFYFGRVIAELGKRYDGHPDLEAVDLSIVGAYGEGEGTEYLTEKTFKKLMDVYIDNFKKTPLVPLLTIGDNETTKYALSRADVGWRVDCIGDLGFFSENFTHMHDFYPQVIIKSGMKDAWRKAPVHLEVCGTIEGWKDEPGSCRWCQGYNLDDLKYIINETLKWHVSSFNNKSTAVPDEWRPYIDEWLKKMGYRFVLRKFSYPESLGENKKLTFQSWWDNKGVAPCYKKFALAIKIENKFKSEVMITDADVTSWLPGDNIYDDAVFLPRDVQKGIYDLKIGIIDKQSHEPKVKFAIEGKDENGWYYLGKIKIE